MDRYLAGDHEAVCEELAALGPAVVADPNRGPAEAIATEMMRRIRRNAELLSTRWRAAGWEFGYGWASEPAQTNTASAPAQLGPPQPDAADRLERLERRIGAVPLVVRAFVTQIGSLNFVGRPIVPAELEDTSDEELLAAGWVWPGQEECDPVQVAPDLAGLEHDDGRRDLTAGAISTAQPEPPGHRYLLMWPDRYLKYFLSGAGSFGTLLPQPGFDATIHFNGNVAYHVDGTIRVLSLADPIPGWTLVRYLRWVLLEAGGFGAEPFGPPGYRNQDFVDQLTTGLEPF